MKESGSRNEIAINHVMFATDFSTAAENAFSYALAIAGRYSSKLYIAHVVDSESFELLDDDSMHGAAAAGYETDYWSTSYRKAMIEIEGELRRKDGENMPRENMLSS